MMMRDSLPKYEINFAFDESKIKYDFTTECKLSEVIEIKIFERFEKAKSVTNGTF
jgi:exoribonuclease R